jgi:hypothetical protein
MPKRIDSLTDGQRAAMTAHADHWITRALDCSEPDWSEWERGMQECYRFANLETPTVVVRVPNPLVGALAFPIAAHLIERAGRSRQVDDAVDDAVGGAVGDAVGDAVGGAVGDAVRGAIGDAVRGAVGGAVGDAVGGAVRDAVRGAVDGAVRGAVGGAVDDAVGDAVDDAVRNHWRYRIGGQHWTSSWRWGSAYTSFFRDHCDLELGGDIWDRARAWERANTVGWWWPHKQFVMVCERPKFVRREQVRPRGWGSHRLHCEDGPAIGWEGWELYFWHGLQVPAEAFTQPGWLDADRITREQNAELRRAFMEIYGQGRYIREAGGELLDEVHEPPFPGLIDAKLWRLPNPDGPEPLVCVECRNSTPEPNGEYKIYSLWVHPECRPLLTGGELGKSQELTAHNALASTYGEYGPDYAPTVET